MLAWLTVDGPGDAVCRALVVPVNFVPMVMGALGELCDASNWEQHGTMTPEECAEVMSEMWASFEEC